MVEHERAAVSHEASEAQPTRRMSGARSLAALPSGHPDVARPETGAEDPDLVVHSCSVAIVRRRGLLQRDI